jgi:serine/threonine protein kinase
MTAWLKVSDRLYRTLLIVYPAQYRREYGPLMAQVFRDLCRDVGRRGGAWGFFVLWIRTLADLAITAVAEHLEGTMIDLPATIGKYEVKELIGEGSNASIYRAHDPDRKRDVAVKLINPDVIDDWRPQLQRQIEILSTLDHPGLPLYYEFVDNGEQAYVVLEFIEGQDLLRLMESQEGFLPVAQVVNWAKQVCDILTYLHTQPEPLIFRDVKPHQSMITPKGRVLLIDFGTLEPYAPGRAMPKIGTEGYAPPEQYEGFCDPRTDVFALGASMHHLLTRVDPRKQKPFEFRFDPPRAINPAVSEDLESVILKAVARDAADRFQSAVEMKTALAGCV